MTRSSLYAAAALSLMTAAPALAAGPVAGPHPLAADPRPTDQTFTLPPLSGSYDIDPEDLEYAGMPDFAAEAVGPVDSLGLRGATCRDTFREPDGVPGLKFGHDKPAIQQSCRAEGRTVQIGWAEADGADRYWVILYAADQDGWHLQTLHTTERRGATLDTRSLEPGWYAIQVGGAYGVRPGPVSPISLLNVMPEARTGAMPEPPCLYATCAGDPADPTIDPSGAEFEASSLPADAGLESADALAAAEDEIDHLETELIAAYDLIDRMEQTNRQLEGAVDVMGIQVLARDAWIRSLQERIEGLLGDHAE